ncbi:MAG: FtsQ-type POTRA domain-containing protein [Proteobacteria bacterium]|nr:FtsQ-type POTRA domain-containing protein [Pseudomonadota bacterium]
MKSRIKIFFLLFIFLILTTYNHKNNNESSSIFFPIKEIFIENNIGTDLLALKSDLSFLINTSLFFLDEKKILEATSKHEFISSVQIKKKYLNALKIIINEKIPLATQTIDRNKFYIIKDNEKINFKDIKIYEGLPSVFGKYKNFDIFYNDLEKSNFKVKEIKTFYYFDVGRWDIELKNEKIIKFPENNYVDFLPRINSILDDSNFSKYKIFDFRVKDQLILK